MNGYFDTLVKQQVTIVLGGQPITIERARLGLHLQLGQLVDEFDNAPGSPEMALAIKGYFKLLEIDIGQASVVEILRAYQMLREVNRWQFILAFMKNTAIEKQPESYDYEGRNWAWVIHKLASRYGWTRDYIFNLWPEEAAIYLQEILISEHNEAEERYRLSELAYQYNEVTRKSHYVPYQKPSWMLNYELPKPVRVLKSHLPFGVQTLDGQSKIYH